MARRTNYGFEKKQRELKKQKKRERKAEKKRLRKEQAERGGPDQDAAETDEEQE